VQPVTRMVVYQRKKVLSFFSFFSLSEGAAGNEDSSLSEGLLTFPLARLLGLF
jgi:hypothetical protein